MKTVPGPWMCWNARAVKAGLRILAAIHSPDAIGKILDCLGLPCRAPPISSAVPESMVRLDPF